jgi:hypothetical protein
MWGGTMTEPTKRAPRVPTKLRAGARRDAELIAFCYTQFKESKRSMKVSDRRDAVYWRDLALYLEQTNEDGTSRGIPRAPVPTAFHLEKLSRSLALVARLQAAEVATLRSQGMSWQMIGDATGLTREGARRKWPDPEPAPSAEA